MKKSESGEKYAQIKHHLQAKTVQNCSKQICQWFRCKKTARNWLFYFHLFTHYSGFWNYILARSDSLKLKHLIDEFITKMQLLASQDLNWSHVDYLWFIVMFFISCLDSYSDGTHSLQRIHWWASDVMLHFFQSDEETNSSTYWMSWGRVKV